MNDSYTVARTRRFGVALLAAVVAASLLPLSLSARADGAFVDDNSSVHESSIEYIAARNITVGCNPPANSKYCPERPVTRGEMAVFLQRAFELKSGKKDRFVDDNGSQFESAINAVGKAGITAGCNPPKNDRFCPDKSVTRGEMAAFLTRALDLDTGGNYFADDDSSVFEGDINAVARVGLARGSNPPANSNYCPDRSVTRGEMATFITRAMEIDRTGTTTTIKPPDNPGGRGGGGSNPPGTPPPPPSSAECRAVGAPMSGPSNPKGDVKIQPGQSIQAAVDKHSPGTKFVIAAGVHKNQTVSPKNNNQFIGEPGAVLDGGGKTEYAFGGPGDDVLIEGLEIRNYNSKVSEGVVRSVNQGLRWTVRANEIHSNGGQGVKFIGGWKIIGNYLHNNEQYGIGGTGNNVLIERNEIAYNNPKKGVNPYWGAGGTKFVNSHNLVIRSNCSHDNVGPGLWTDGHNVNALYEGNLVFANEHAGIKHEVSCAATIRNNTAIGNGFGNPNWLAGAGIVVLNSPDVTVTGNVVVDNADGIAGIQGNRKEVNGRNCRLELKNLKVSGNTVEKGEGYSGVVTDATNQVFSSWNNQFTGNTYVLKPEGDKFFMWDGKRLTLKEWKAKGHG